MNRIDQRKPHKTGWDTFQLMSLLESRTPKPVCQADIDPLVPQGSWAWHEAARVASGWEQLVLSFEQPLVFP